MEQAKDLVDLSKPEAAAAHRRIVDAAAELFATKGYAKTSVGDIAGAVGMSPANLYRYHRNKQAIGMAVVEAFMSEALHLRETALAAPVERVEDRLRGFLAATAMFTVTHLRRAPKLVELANMVFETPEGRAFAERERVAYVGLVEGLIADGVAAGEFAVENAAVAARAVTLSTEIFNSPAGLTQHGLDDVETEFSQVLDLLCAGLRAGARGSAAAG